MYYTLVGRLHQVAKEKIWGRSDLYILICSPLNFSLPSPNAPRKLVLTES